MIWIDFLGLAGFKAVLKKQMSMQRGESVSSGGKPSFSKQMSIMSQHSIGRDESSYSLSDHLSHFSMEDLPIAASPSPFPGRKTILGAEEMPMGDDEEDVFSNEVSLQASTSILMTVTSIAGPTGRGN